MTTFAVNPEMVKQLTQAHAEPLGLARRRNQAYQLWTDSTLPEIRQFKFRNWDFFDPLTIQWQNSDPQLLDQTQVLKQNQGLVQFGQTTTAVHLSADLEEQGIILSDIFSAFQMYPELLEQYFNRAWEQITTDQLLNYNNAFFTSGIFLYIPPQTVISEPLELQIIQDSTRKQPLISHCLIVVAENSAVTIDEHLSTVGANSNQANLCTEVLAGANSQVKFAALDELAEATTFYFRKQALLADNAHIEWSVGLMNSGNTVGQIESRLAAPGSRADSNVIAVTEGQQQVGINNTAINEAPHTVSNINQHGVLLNDSQLVFNGIGNIIHGAHGSQAEQKNKILMMSNQAVGKANPILFIHENDVEAGHAASVGPVDPSQLYYLTSRGIPYAQAKRLVIRGFLGSVIGSVTSKATRERMIAVLERKLQRE